MLKRFIVETPFNESLSRLYYYKNSTVHYKYLDGSHYDVTDGNWGGKTLEELIDLIPVGLRVITSEDEITRILTMHELVT